MDVKFLAQLVAGIAMAAIIGFVAFGPSQIWGGVEAQEAILQEELDRFDRSVTLAEKPELARDQLRATTYLVTLRSAHCQALSAAISSGDDSVDAYGEGGEFGEIRLLEKDERRSTDEYDILRWGFGNENHFDVLLPAFTFETFSGTLCEGEESMVEMTGLDEVIEFANGPLGYLGSAAMSAAHSRTVEPVANFLGLGSSSGLEEVVENSNFENHPGLFGNVGFEYPEEAEAPIVIQADNPRHQLQRKGEGLPGFEGAPESGHRAGEGESFWLGEEDEALHNFAITFVPDSDIWSWIGEGDSPPPFRPAMENVPMITSSDVESKYIVDSYSLIGETAIEDIDDIDPHRDYEFVICPGSTGRIQSNINEPDYDGTATSDMDNENLAFPFVELSANAPTDCVSNYDFQTGGHGFSWSTLENSNLERSDVDLSCDSYSHITQGGEVVEVGDTYYTAICGVNSVSGAPSNLYEFQIYVAGGERSEFTCEPRIENVAEADILSDHGYNPMEVDEEKFIVYQREEPDSEIDRGPYEGNIGAFLGDDNFFSTYVKSFEVDAGATKAEVYCEYEESTQKMAVDQDTENLEPEVFMCNDDDSDDSIETDGAWDHSSRVEESAEAYCENLPDFWNEVSDKVPVALYFVEEREHFPLSTQDERFGDYIYDYDTYDVHEFQNFQFQSLFDFETEHAGEIVRGDTSECDYSYLSNVEEIDDIDDVGNDDTITIEEYMCVDLNQMGLEFDNYEDNRVENWEEYWNVANAGGLYEGRVLSDIISEGDNLNDDRFFPGGFYPDCPSGVWDHANGGGCVS